MLIFAADTARGFGSHQETTKVVKYRAWRGVCYVSEIKLVVP